MNPVNKDTYDYIRGAIQELLSDGSFNDSNTSVHPIIHLGGDEIAKGCWKEDPSISAYMTQFNLTASYLWQQFHQKVNDIIASICA